MQLRLRTAATLVILLHELMHYIRRYILYVHLKLPYSFETSER